MTFDPELVYARLLLPAAAKHGDTASFFEVEVDEREFLGAHVERSIRLADALRSQLGIAAGDRFAVLAGNSRYYINLWHAALLGGGILTPINTRLAAPEIEQVLSDSGAVVVIVDADHADLVAELRQRLRAVRHVVLVDEDHQPSASHDSTLGELIAAGSSTLPPGPHEAAPALLLYTGGTTGRPKGVVHTQRSLTLSVYRMGIMLECFTRPSTYLQATPMFHIGAGMGALTVPVSGGSTVIQRRFDPAGAIEIIDRWAITVTGLVPTMLGMIVHDPTFEPERLRTLRLVAYGASPMPSGLLAELERDLPHVDLIQTYGLTETAGVLTALTAADHRRGDAPLRSAGRSLPGVDIAVRDDADVPVPAGVLGEVCVRSGSLMAGYHGRPDDTAVAMRGGWLHTGDIGYLDDSGFLYLVDRASDMIVTGGENVHCSEVEDAISTHPAVAQVAVFGVPSERWGESVHAVVVCRDDMTVTSAEILKHTRSMLAGYKIPRSIEIRTEPLPLTGAMKIRKQELRAEHWRGHDRMIG
jgi:long-chain acyl-CoA synthetase